MKQTLLLIPMLWIQIAWAIGCLIAVVAMWRRDPRGRELLGVLPLVGISGVVVFFVLKYAQIEMINPGDPGGEMLRGLPIRGYGLFLLLATVSGVGTAAWRAKRLGQNPDHVFTLAFWMFILGIAGARLFFIIQKAPELNIQNATDFLANFVRMTEGGLVVYGGLIGALLAFVGFMWWKKLPMLEFGDIIAPSMILGLAIGRIGCLMNGCCFGGPCNIEQVAIQFPQTSPPYLRQLETGELLGIEGDRKKSDDPLQPIWFVANTVQQDSIAAEKGIKPGTEYRVLFDTQQLERVSHGLKTEDILLQFDSQTVGIPTSSLPRSSLKIHPTQIYSAVNAGLIFLFLWFFFPFRRRSGQVLAVLLMIYPISRTVLEFIRTDELGLWGTPFTISQWVSLFVFGLALGIYAKSMLGPERQPAAG